MNNTLRRGQYDYEWELSEKPEQKNEIKCKDLLSLLS